MKRKPRGRPLVPATEDEQRLARWGLWLMENYQLEVVLVPAPVPMFRGHKVRQVVTENPPFYKRMAAYRDFVIDRQGVVRALNRIISGGKDPHGLEEEILEELQTDEDDLKREHGL